MLNHLDARCLAPSIVSNASEIPLNNLLLRRPTTIRCLAINYHFFALLDLDSCPPQCPCPLQVRVLIIVALVELCFFPCFSSVGADLNFCNRPISSTWQRITLNFYCTILVAVDRRTTLRHANDTVNWHVLDCPNLPPPLLRFLFAVGLRREDLVIVLLVVTAALAHLYCNAVEPLDAPCAGDTRRDNSDRCTMIRRQRLVVHLKCYHDRAIGVHGPRQRYAGAVVFVVLSWRLEAGECDMCVFPLVFLNFDACLIKNVFQKWPGPFTVHDGTVKPVDAGYFLQLGAHSVAPVAGTL